jgi:hypothetical protein
MRYSVRICSASMIISVMLTQASYAQPIPGMSPREKAALEEKKAQEKDADKTYKSTLGNIPDHCCPVDGEARSGKG